jgi:predicted dehydrogenase
MMVAPALARSPEVSFAGVLGSSGERGAALAREHGVATAYGSLSELLGDDSIDAVWIATHDVLHHPICLACLESGKHVLVEKPMTVTTDEARELVAVAQREDKVLKVGTHQRFRPAFADLRDLVQSGKLGRLGLVRIAFYAPFPPEKVTGSWRATLEGSGGSWITKEFGAHLLDQLLWWTGGELEVTGAIDATILHEVETEDSVVILLRLPEGGIGVVCASAGVAVDSLSLSVELRGADDWATAEGIWRGGGYLETGGRRTTYPGDDATVPYVRQLADFAATVEGGSAVGADGADGLAVVELVEAARLLSRTPAAGSGTTIPA